MSERGTTTEGEVLTPVLICDVTITGQRRESVSERGTTTEGETLTPILICDNAPTTTGQKTGCLKEVQLLRVS